eukprot:COSAG05_NODE_32_length_28165_cov_450.666714_24_plen_103_part_00
MSIGRSQVPLIYRNHPLLFMSQALYLSHLHSMLTCSHVLGAWRVLCLVDGHGGFGFAEEPADIVFEVIFLAGVANRAEMYKTEAVQVGTLASLIALADPTVS